MAATKTRYTKDDVQLHAESYYGPMYPAVNVKIYNTPDSVKLPLDLGSSYPVGRPEMIRFHESDAGFTHEWLEMWVFDNAQAAEEIWQMACQDGYEQAESLAHDIFGPFAEVSSEGRSGGWIIVRGLPPVEGWDAITLAQWRKFERICTLIKNDVPRSFVESIYMNVWEVENG